MLYINDTPVNKNIIEYLAFIYSDCFAIAYSLDGKTPRDKKYINYIPVASKISLKLTINGKEGKCTVKEFCKLIKLW